MSSPTRWFLALPLAALMGCGVDVYDPIIGFLGDRDGDGWADIEEQEAGSDPENPFHWDFGSGQWPDFTDEAERGLANANFGYGIGDTMPDFLSQDQYGNAVPLHTFYGYVILVDFVAGWCEPCKETAVGAQQTWVEHRLDGVLVIHMVVDDYDEIDPGVDTPFQRQWADSYGIDFPVLYDDRSLAYGGFLDSGLAQGFIPFMVVVDHELRVVAAFEGSDELEAAEALAVELAAERDRNHGLP